MTVRKSHDETPRYVALISDGSVRWAQARGLSVTSGHAAAADTVVATAYNALDLGVEELTIYAFSTENWRRPIPEIQGLFSVIAERVREEITELGRHGVRVRCIGRMDEIPAELRAEVHFAEAMTRANDRMVLYVALNYGGRAELIDAARRFQGTTEEEFQACLYAPDMHDPEVLIRTGNERRLSNYLPWQTAYSELIFRTELWPDFTREVFVDSLEEFTARRRRFGGR